MSESIQATKRILIVDDDAGTAKVVRDWYKGKPFEILEARDGDEGVRLAELERPDIILMDLMMPRTNGFEATQRLRAGAATKAIPVILLSAQRAGLTKRAGFKIGIDDYVEKPFDLDELDARIALMLERRTMVESLQTANRTLDALATIDEKTGLANYRVFIQKLREEWLRAERYGQALSLVMMDLDDFKRVNDRFGHPAGDRVLREFATLVHGGARATDVPARYGGEEFAIILPHTVGERAERVAERIRAAVEEFTFLAPDHPIRVTVSAGVATYPEDAAIGSADELLAAADRALYAAKKAGKNRVVVAPA